ncbi:pilus assembly PilX family protein [Ectothiorhodospira variabilis]|uniref:pilus assembly PilX family protein n=1 Tax=Ectothiorhodospira variabilis TaxID=505694 RepID=UPI001EFB1100|nr:pilus assembly PilX N-terminal domain-containing protein [Ectothiorhodospira variabilis]MCG5493555.1 pilus assembly PilX N-terminal domain-containing protein [Ectothiorhodospira variabilis]MCG5502884.1 pilus assembly PilX N-terminal domain-containing protein [Ectothiorhodospira variabilis]MCG5506328.1 pilus assembly PilX N-terminal domain-containing protein [Ectothiorhodospira variabilis]
MNAPKSTQRGTVLVVSLIILAMATLIGLAGMNGSFIQERVAGNQKQTTEAFMAAETGMSEVLGILRDNSFTHWGDREESVKAIGDHDRFLGNGQVVAWRLADLSYQGGTARVRIQGEVVATGTRRMVEVELDRGLGGPTPESAYTCYGADCTTRTGSNSNNAIYYDGRDWQVPTGTSCSGAGCNGTIVSDRSGDKAGIYLIGNDANDAIGTGNQDGNNRPDQIQGDPPLRQTDASVSTGGVSAGDWQQYADALISRPDTAQIDVNTGNTVDVSQFLGSRSAPAVNHVTGTGSIRLSGNTHGAGILIVSGDIEIFPANGTMTFEGLIILRDGARLSSGSGTANVFGSIISLTGNEDAVDADLGGNFSLKYSSQALENLRDHGLWGSPLSAPRVVTWKEVVNTDT